MALLVYTFITETMTHQLYFVPRVLINRDGTKRVIQADTEVKLQLIHKELSAIYSTEYLSDHQKDHLLDVIDSLQEVLSYFGDPGDSFGEPPVTLDEMHTAAWQQHKEMHSSYMYGAKKNFVSSILQGTVVFEVSYSG